MEFINKCIDYVKANLWLGIVLAVVAALIVVLIIVAIVKSSKKKRAKTTAEAQPQPQRTTMEEGRAAELQANAEARAKKAAEEKAKHDAIWAEVEAKLEAQRLAAEQEQANSQTAPSPIQEETAPLQADAPVCVDTTADEAEAAAKAEEERIAREQAEAAAKAEEERIAREKAAAEKLAREQEEAREKAAAERAAKEKALAEAKAEAEAAAKAEEERIAREKAEEEARAKAAAERAAKEQAEAEAKAKAEEEARAKAQAEAAVAANKGPELYEELKDVEMEDDIWYDENETDIAARYKGKWLICRMITEDASEDEMFFFELHASNGEKLLSSEEYTSYAGALRGIATHKANIEKGNFKITLSKKGDYIFKLLSGKNLLLCMGENYPTRARCENAIESTKRFAATAVIDENVQDQVVKVPVEDNSEVLPILPNGKGKWIISSAQGANGEQLFYFELFANNGEKLLSSEEYTTYIGAINGIETHKANIQKDNFRITLTKRGDYIYKLLNGNGQLLCLGEHYKTKRLCQNAVDSVKRFAINSPVLTDAKMLD